MFSKGNSTVTLNDILNKVSESQILAFYLNIFNLPKVIKSPLREDNKPSFGLYTSNNKVYYKDFANSDSGGLFDLLQKLWHLTFPKVLEKIHKDIYLMTQDVKINTLKKEYNKKNHIKSYNDSILNCKIRDWRDYDITYWEHYGISLLWLQYAEIYPISHKIIIQGNKQYIFGADKYAYAFIEHKENKETMKIYQPFSKNYKWINKHDKSIISLWTKLPKTGNIVCICSSVKDALCLWANTNIPSIAIQGEGYLVSDTVIKELKQRFKHPCIMLDNDDVGLKDAEKLSNYTKFTNVILPPFKGGKDISDYYAFLQDRKVFSKHLIQIFKKTLK